MAVVKANYVKRGKGDRARAKSTIRYITHRRTRENEKITRALFGYDGLLTKEQAYRMIDEAQKGTIFYRFVISPDPRREDTRRDLSIEDITIDTMIKLEERLGKQIQFVATLHDNHTNNRHAHVVALVKGRRLTREDFQALRQEATHLAEFQRRMRDLTLARDRGQYRNHQQQAAKTRARGVSTSPRTHHAGAPGYILRPLDRPYNHSRPFASFTCSICSHHEALASTNRIFATEHRCPNCGIKMRRDRALALTISPRTGKEAGYS
jgi:hypothetical protein